MDLARVVHVLAVIIWIGGVAMVTLVLLPAMRRLGPAEERVAMFERLESGFARLARWMTLLTAASGFYLLDALGWERLWVAQFWWLHAMIGVWAIFTSMLFVLEPLFLHRWFVERGRRAPESTFALIQGLHYLLLTISLVTVAGAVAGSHGWFWF